MAPPRMFIDDQEFDAVLPFAMRCVSRLFWTPAMVARRAASLLVRQPSARVLDVGSGVGKFCIIGAAATGATFVGVEHRPHFVLTAEETARRLGVDSVRFSHGTVDAVDVLDFNGIYFFNPFEENLWGSDDRLDETVSLSDGRYFEDVKRAEEMLSCARPGTRVVTYHGFGGQMPASFRLDLREPCQSGYLELWVKRSTAGPHSIRQVACDFSRVSEV